MNPNQDNPDTTQAGDNQPPFDPATAHVPANASPQADLAALEAISTLEAEEDTSNSTQAPMQPEQPQSAPQAQPTPYTAQGFPSTQPVQPQPTEPQPSTQTQPVVEVMTPFVSEQPTVAANDLPPVAAVPVAPVQTNADPFTKQKKSSKKLIIILIAAVVIIGGLVAGYFVWQSAQNSNTVETTDSTGGNQPGGAIETPSDTESSVNSSTTSLVEGADSVNDTVYDDSALSDATLYEN